VQLRRELRRRRRNLSAPQQRHHAIAIARRLSGMTLFRNAQRIALYLESDGEPGTSPLLARLWRYGKRAYLPVLRKIGDNRLHFCEYRRGDSLPANRFGIAEPDPRHRPPTPPWGLDLILLPLVGFDGNGQRLGMGGGFYDRTLAFSRHRHHWRGPRLIGIAHECQRVADLPSRPWDIPLHGIVTERTFYPAPPK
jgi:5-formyltetrahydrofolate cyclo-ligase